MTRDNNNRPKEPRVSIGLCVWNGEKYLKQALDSLRAQTYENFELIISDNASADKTRKICEEYARGDSRIRYIRQKENIGSFANYDFVRREARGDYFMYASDDDLWDRQFIEKCLAGFKNDPAALVVFPNFCTFDDSGRVMKYSQGDYFPFAKETYERLKSYILSRGQYGKSTIIYGLWRKGTPVDKIVLDKYRSDMFYIFSALEAGRFISVKETLFFKRLPTQFPFDANKRLSSIDFLTNLTESFEYETVDDWLQTRKEAIRGRSGWVETKEFIADRVQASKYSYIYARYILKSFKLSFGEKARLLGWNLYAYLRSFWYGHV